MSTGLEPKRKRGRPPGGGMNAEELKEANRRYQRKHWAKHRDRRNAWQNKYRREVWTKIPKHRIDAAFRGAIRLTFKGKNAGKKWELLVGYSMKDLMVHFENLFDAKMTWDNYGTWEIDHIRPKYLFKYDTPEDPEFRNCWALENLQPLHRIDNLLKGKSVPQRNK